MKIGDRVKARESNTWLGDETWIVVKCWGDDHYWIKSELHGTITDTSEDEVELCTF
jgi:hypothetical protein